MLKIYDSICFCAFVAKLYSVTILSEITVGLSGITMGLSGIKVGLKWDHHGTTVGVQCYQHGRSVGAVWEQLRSSYGVM